MRLQDLYGTNFSMAVNNLQRNQVRSFLAMLGIVIGVLAIASIGMFGNTLRSSASDTLGDIGNRVVITPSEENNVEELNSRDIQQIQRLAPLADVIPLKVSRNRVEYSGQTRVLTVYGTDQAHLLFASQEVPERLSNGALVGTSVAEDFDLRQGNTIRIDGRPMRVRELLESESSGFSTVSATNSVVISEADHGQMGYSRVIIEASSGSEANRIAEAVRNNLNERRKRVEVQELSSIVDSISSFISVLNTILIGIGGISLVVAGISILNVMLMSTVERRNEIGVLRAVGGSKLDIMKMILMEASLLGVIGGVFGIVMSVAVGLVLHHSLFSDPLMTFNLGNFFYFGMAFVFALVTSLVSGLYPAWKAATENPVEALRS